MKLDEIDLDNIKIALFDFDKIQLNFVDCS